MFSSIIHAIRSRLATRLILVVVLLISAVSVLLTAFFISHQKQLLTEELFSRSRSLAHNLAYNSRDCIVFGDRRRLLTLVRGVDEEPDIETVFVTDLDGTNIASTDTALSGQTFTVPDETHLIGSGMWITNETEISRRLVVPIDVDAPLIDTDSPFVSSLNTRDIAQNIYRIGGLQPNFNHTSDEIIFTATIHGYDSFGLLSISIDDRTVRLLAEPATNGFWSTTGRYIVYNTGYPTFLSVLDTVTGKVTVIAEDKTSIHGAPRFTHDDRYVIATLPTADGLNRLFRIPRDGGEAVQLTFHTGNHWLPDCSGDGTRIVYTDISSRTIYVYDIRTRESFRLFPDMEERHCSGAFSPDGTQICYVRNVDDFKNNWDVFVADFPVDHSKPASERYGRRLTTTGNYKIFVDWSPDGSLITYAQRILEQLTFDVWIVSPEGGRPPVNLTAGVVTHKTRMGYAVLDVSTENLNRAIATGRLTALVISLFFTGIGILSAFVLVRNIVRPVQEIAHVAGKIARGNLDNTISTQRSDEIGVLADSFDRMIKQLKILLDEKDIRNRELEKAYGELKTLDKAKDDFVSLVSHELRTPLSSIILYTQMLLDEQVDTKEKRERYLTTIISNSKRLARLVNDVLDISKIESGVMPFERDTFQAREIIEEVKKYFTPELTAHKISLECDSIPGNMFLVGDRDKTIQVVSNIISNAIKYTPSGGTICITLRRDEKKATIAVTDTGKGIPEQDIPKIFDRFYQLENIEHHSDGSGLGMTISKSIVEHQGGKIWVESEMGKGTTVFFTMPVSKEKSGLTYTTSHNEKNNLSVSNNSLISWEFNNILIVDDEESIRTALTDCVKNAGFHPIAAQNGEEALHLVREHHPAVIILDVMMPGMSGLQVCRRLRDDPKTSGIKIIMLSARGQQKEKSAGMKAGADRYITKPFDYVDLMKIVEELLEIENNNHDA